MKLAKHLLSAVLALAMLLTALPLSAITTSAAWGDCRVSFTIDEPIPGEHPDFTVNSAKGTNAGRTDAQILSTARVQWFDIAPYTSLTEDDVFQSGKSYMVRISYDYDSHNPPVYGYINGEYVTCSNRDFEATYEIPADETGYREVEVSTYMELRSQLQSNENVIITLASDIFYRVRPVAYVSRTAAEEHEYNPYEDLDPDEYDIRYDDDPRGVTTYDTQMEVNGNKILNLNGHNITVEDNGNVTFVLQNLDLTDDFYRHTLPGETDTYDRALMTVTDGSKLTIRDDTAKPGTIHYDAWMITVPDVGADNILYCEYAIRDIVRVEAGVLVVENGILEAGRSKEQWIVDGTDTPDDFDDRQLFEEEEILVGQNGYFNGNAYQQIWGSAIHAASSNSQIYINGGKFFGRGMSSNTVLYEYNEEKKKPEYDIDYKVYRDAVIDGSASATIIINGGYFNARGGADVFHFDYVANHYGIAGNDEMAKNLVIRSANFARNKVDYVRILDAPISNDTGVGSAVAIGLAAAIVSVSSMFMLVAAPASFTFLAAALGTGASVGASFGVMPPTTPCVIEGTYGDYNIYEEYFESIIDDTRFTIGYEDSHDLTTYKGEWPADLGTAIRIDPAHNGEKEYLSVNYGTAYVNSHSTDLYWSGPDPLTLTVEHEPYYARYDRIEDHRLVYRWVITGNVNLNAVQQTITTKDRETTINPLEILGIDGYFKGYIKVTCNVIEERTETASNALMYSTEPVTIHFSRFPMNESNLPGGKFDIDIGYQTTGNITGAPGTITVKVNPSPEQLNVEAYDYTKVYEYRLIYTNRSGEQVVLYSTDGVFEIDNPDYQHSKISVRMAYYCGEDEYDPDGIGNLIEKEFAIFRHASYKNTNMGAAGTWSDDYTTYYATGSNSVRLHNRIREDGFDPVNDKNVASTTDYAWFKQTGVDSNGDPIWTMMNDYKWSDYTYVSESGTYCFGVKNLDGEYVYALPIRVCYGNDNYQFKITTTGASKVTLTKNSVESQPTLNATTVGGATDGKYEWRIIAGPTGWQSSGIKSGWVKPASKSESITLSKIFFPSDEKKVIPGEYTIQARRMVGVISVWESDPITIQVDRKADAPIISIRGEQVADYYQCLSLNKTNKYSLSFAPKDGANLPAMSNIRWSIETLVGTNVGTISDGVFYPLNPGRVRITATATTSSGTVTDSVIIDVPIENIYIYEDTSKLVSGGNWANVLTVDPSAPYTISFGDGSTIGKNYYPEKWIDIEPKDGYVFASVQEEDYPNSWAVSAFFTTVGLVNESGKVGKIKEFNYSGGMEKDGSLEYAYELSMCITYPFVYDDNADYLEGFSIDFEAMVGEEYQTVLGAETEMPIINGATTSLNGNWVMWSSLYKVNSTDNKDTDVENDTAVKMNAGEVFEKDQLYRIDFTVVSINLGASTMAYFAQFPVATVNGKNAIVQDLTSSNLGVLGETYTIVSYYFYAGAVPEEIAFVKLTGVEDPVQYEKPTAIGDVKTGHEEVEVKRLVWFYDDNGNGKVDQGETDKAIFETDGSFRFYGRYSLYVELAGKDRDGDGVADYIKFADDVVIVVGENDESYYTMTGNADGACYTYAPATAAAFALGADTAKAELTGKLGYTTAPSKTIAVTSTGLTNVTALKAVLGKGSFFEVTTSGMNVIITAKSGLGLGTYNDMLSIADANGNTMITIPVTLTIAEGGMDVNVTTYGNIDYSVNGQTVTVEHRFVCKAGYYVGSEYVALNVTDNGDGTYSFTAPEAVDEVFVVAAGNVNLDATVDYSDLQVLYQHLSTSNKLTGIALDAANVNGDGQIDFSDLQRLFANLSGQ